MDVEREDRAWRRKVGGGRDSDGVSSRISPGVVGLLVGSIGFASTQDGKGNKGQIWLVWDFPERGLREAWEKHACTGFAGLYCRGSN